MPLFFAVCFAVITSTLADPDDPDSPQFTIEVTLTFRSRDDSGEIVVTETKVVRLARKAEDEMVRCVTPVDKDIPSKRVWVTLPWDDLTKLAQNPKSVLSVQVLEQHGKILVIKTKEEGFVTKDITSVELDCDCFRLQQGKVKDDADKIGDFGKYQLMKMKNDLPLPGKAKRFVKIAFTLP